MEEGITRHSFLAVLVVCTVVLTGCVSLPGNASEDCGPGPDRIENLGQTQNATVEGTIQSINETSILVDDGTGTALLVTDRSYNTSVATVGDCVVAEGRTAALNRTNGTTDYDVALLVGNVSVKS